MRRALPLLALTVFAFAPRASAQATSAACEGSEVAEAHFAWTAPPPVDVEAPAPGGVPDWCESPDDPRCSPLAPAPAVPTLGGMPILIAVLPTPARSPRLPQLSIASFASGRLVGPSPGVADRVDRPPLAR